jgi:hypothetical protein
MKKRRLAPLFLFAGKVSVDCSDRAASGEQRASGNQLHHNAFSTHDERTSSLRSGDVTWTNRVVG